MSARIPSFWGEFGVPHHAVSCSINATRTNFAITLKEAKGTLGTFTLLQWDMTQETENGVADPAYTPILQGWHVNRFCSSKVEDEYRVLHRNRLIHASQ